MSHEDRPRYSLEECRQACVEGSNAIMHVLDNGDETYSIMQHIVCEWCDYCDTQGDCRSGGGPADFEPVPFKEDPYENQHE